MSENKMTAANQQRKEITVKFGKGLVSEPFTAKTGRECVSIAVPNTDPGDKRPWAQIIVPSNHVHENMFGKGMWMKLPAEGETKLYRSEVTGQSANGKKTYSNSFEMVPNTKIKDMLESYKNRNIDHDKAVPSVPKAKKSYNMER